MPEEGPISEGAAPAAPSEAKGSGLDLIGLTKVFPGGTVAVDDFNLHVDHQAAAIADAASAFVRLIDHAIAHQGSYFLTYHRFARPDQVFACHPGLRRWLTTKHRIDPYQTFQSDWYQHLLRLTGKEAA